MSLTISQTDDIGACLALRRTVFIEEQNVPEDLEVDGLDEGALHILARDGSQPVGAARLLLKGHVAKIGRVCVLKQYRGTGAGQALIRCALDVAKAQNGVTLAQLGAQTHALGFYESLGFKPFGPVYDEAGIPHRDMERAL